MAKKVTRRMKKTTPHHSRRYLALFVVSILLIGYMLWQVLGALSAPSSAQGRGRGKLCRSGQGTFFSFCKVGEAGACNAGCTCDAFSKKFAFGVCRGDGSKNVPPIKPCKDKTKFPEKPGNKTKGTETPDTDAAETTDTENDVSVAGKEHAEKVPCAPDVPPTMAPSTVPQPTVTPGGTGTGTVSCGTTCTQDSECASGFCNPSGFAICPTAAPGQPIEGCQFIPPDPTAPSVCAPMTCKVDNTNAAACACPAAGNALR
ncbi:hypothetical protein HYS00_05595 [Candidatus Microgenomates bacterium]|nr:hypothetical protein [Candidatus Microgenomates bacterium]